LHLHTVTGRYSASGYDNAENAASVLRPASAASEHLASQAFLKAVDLPAWCPQARQLDDRVLTEMELCPERQMLQSDPMGRDVFTEMSGPDEVANLSKLRKQLSWYEMDLTPVRKLRQPPRKESMLHVLARVRITFHAVAFDARNALPRLFAEFMLGLVRNTQHFPFAAIYC
jgi:hypothetical protein